MMSLVGVDIGGTFTDFVLYQPEEGLRSYKVLSTPANPAEGLMQGLADLGLAADFALKHGTTVATNAILERKGAKTAFLTTAGFRDMLALGRQNRPALYALHPQLPPPLIPRHLCYEIVERLDFQGRVLTPLDLSSLPTILDDMAAQGVEAIAVCLLYSFLDPRHELALEQAILADGRWTAGQISLSSRVLPQFREYERASTTSLDAYVRPIIHRYLGALEARLPTGVDLQVMKSDGGLLSASAIRAQAVQTALSGPAAGVIGAFALGRMAGYERLITLDIGGTSSDVSLCDGAPAWRSETTLDGLPLRIPILDIETIGAGGGSIAEVDAGGALRVGPQSAGSDPGPIIYGRGGMHVTLSDANAYLGRLDPAYFLGGRLNLHLELARSALEKLAEQAGLSPSATALGILEVAHANIERAIRRVSVERGHDPRGFALMAFGGAGGLHACEVAERLEINTVLFPPYAGVLCALGLLLADVQRDYMRAVLAPWGAGLYAQLSAENAALREHAQQELPDALCQAYLDMRYSGQAYELSVPLSAEADEAFHAAHQRAYGYAMPDKTLEVVSLRVRATQISLKPPLPRIEADPHSLPASGTKTLLTSFGPQKAQLYEGTAWKAGGSCVGPALIFQPESTLYVPSGWQARLDSFHLFVMEKTPHA
jgi:N-methylhydantoinase A